MPKLLKHKKTHIPLTLLSVAVILSGLVLVLSDFGNTFTFQSEAAAFPRFSRRLRPLPLLSPYPMPIVACPTPAPEELRSNSTRAKSAISKYARCLENSKGSSAVPTPRWTCPTPRLRSSDPNLSERNSMDYIYCLDSESRMPQPLSPQTAPSSY